MPLGITTQKHEYAGVPKSTTVTAPVPGICSMLIKQQPHGRQMLISFSILFASGVPKRKSQNTTAHRNW